MRVDLHTHSAVSDGTQTPGDVVRSAAEAGLDVVALTDHDTTAGWAEAAEVARERGIRLVPGTEISTAVGGVSVHLLSYLHDPADPALAAELELTRADVAAQVRDGGTVGRPHIADALVARGLVADRSEAFAGLLSSRGPYYVRHYAPGTVDAVRLVVAAGGVPVMAHPLAHRRGRVVSDDVIEAMVEAGLAGLEVHHRDNDEAAREHLLELADRWDLLVTGSSDYHGAGKPNRLGENTTDPEVLARIEAAGTGSRVVG